MRVLLCNSSSSLLLSSPSPPTPTKKSPILLTTNNNWVRKTLLGAFNGALSLNILLSSPFSLAAESPLQLQSPSNPLTEQCLQEEKLEEITGPQTVTNEGIVEEAWQIVNDSFLDAGRHRWTPESWQVRGNSQKYMNWPTKPDSYNAYCISLCFI